MTNSNKKKAFTLAEVLIALTVIGVVAAITLRVLFFNTSDAEYKNKFKKEYSVLAQAVAQASQANGGTFDGIYKHQWSNGFGQSLAPYLKYTQSCNLGIVALGETAGLSVLGNCWINNEFPKLLNGSKGSFGNAFDVYAGFSGFILNDGTFLVLRAIRRYCTGTQTCATAFIDLNGLKEPNTMGKDIYGILIRPNSITPVQDGDITNLLPFVPNCTTNGGSCSSHYLQE